VKRLALGCVLVLALATPGNAEPYRLKPGESLTGVVTRHYGDKYYIWVLELHAKQRLRGRTIALPSLRRILEAEKALSLAPAALEQVVAAQESFHRVSSRNWPSCDVETRWRPAETQQLLRSADQLAGAVRQLRELKPAPRSVITHLERAASATREVAAGPGGPLCKAILSTHKRLVYAFQAAIRWARKGGR